MKLTNTAISITTISTRATIVTQVLSIIIFGSSQVLRLGVERAGYRVSDSALIGISSSVSNSMSSSAARPNVVR